ncbi:RHS repeat-associated core domain-containing protein [Providencia stuartii]|uniref:RHS repeat domain-containing protein n=1 Tax=Providencia stuartii TaxID=588 RepID=UPI003D7FE8D4
MSTQFSSESGNFLGKLKTNVDVRTGQFLVSIPFVNIIANQRSGPDLALSVSYSPLQDANYGFGRGFSIGITMLCLRNNTLELSSGESYKITPGTVNVINKRLKHFILKYTNNTNSHDGYTVIWKDGKSESLTLIGEDYYVTTKIMSELGRELSLSWSWSGEYPLLKRVKDEFQTLCEINYSHYVSIRVFPETNDEYLIKFSLINHEQLNYIACEYADNAFIYWRFGYEALTESNKHYLTQIIYPTGLTEQVEYSELFGFRFPSSSGKTGRLPVVTSYIINPGFGQQKTVKRYKYSEHNFLGFNGDFGDWTSDSDYIYKLLTDYTYSSTETISDGSSEIKTTRVFNNYHLQISEEIERDGCKTKNEIEYYAQKYTPIHFQPEQFQLMKKQVITITDNEGNQRKEISEYEFDEQGNQTLQVTPDGTRVVTTWYKAEGEEDCPAEVNGFIRYMKEKITYPLSRKHNEPINKIYYRYENLANTSIAVIAKQLFYSDEILFKCLSFSYFQDAKRLGYGTPSLIRSTQYTLGENSQHFTSYQQFDYQLNGDTIIKKNTDISFDNIITTTTQTMSILRGVVLEDINQLNVVQIYTYDKLGRPSYKKSAVNTPYETSVSWKYLKIEEGVITIEKDKCGSQFKHYFDGLGRKIRTDVLDAYDSKKWHKIESCQYDAFGKIVKHLQYDHHLSGLNTAEFIYQTTANYDGWGEVTALTQSIGVTDMIKIDPIALTKTTYPINTEVASASRHGKTVITLNKQNQQIESEYLLGIDGKVAAAKYYKSDSLGRLLNITDELGHSIENTYDCFNRIVTQKYEDGTVIHRQYAPHSQNELVTAITVTDRSQQTWLLGEQQFDGLERLVSQTVGGRTTQFQYENVYPEPSVVILPSGEKIHFEYIPELDCLTKKVMTSETTQQFDYDVATQKIVFAKSESTLNINKLNQQGDLIEEYFLIDDQVRKTQYERTVLGTVAKYTDIDNNETRYIWRKDGQIESIIDANIIVTFEYDELGRTAIRKAKSTKADEYVEIKYAYDEFNKEVTREIIDSNGTHFIINKSWLANGLLATQNTFRNTRLIRSEQYQYDVRNRLTNYFVQGSELPKDSTGANVIEQFFEYDALNNLRQVVSVFSGQQENISTYHYENTLDPTQLTRITHSNPHYPATVFTYDACGRMICDEVGRTLKYDMLNRLMDVSVNDLVSAKYGYNASNQLVKQETHDNGTYYLYYRDDELVHEINTSKKQNIRLIKSDHECCAVVDDNQLVFMAAGHNESVCWSRHSKMEEGDTHTFLPYGDSEIKENTYVAFNGERKDPLTGVYHLGNGYRAYNPTIMRFNCPDSLSPFGEGGINPYVYCNGDPINYTDPTGRAPAAAITGILANLASASANIAFAYITSSFAWFAGTTFLTVAGEALGIASIATHDDSPEASNRTSANLGWASIALGVTSVIATSGMFIWRLERMPMPAPRYRAHSVGNGQIQLRRASEVEHHDFFARRMGRRGAIAGGEGTSAESGISSMSSRRSSVSSNRAQAGSFGSDSAHSHDSGLSRVSHSGVSSSSQEVEMIPPSANRRLSAESLGSLQPSQQYAQASTSRAVPSTSRSMYTNNSHIGQQKISNDKLMGGTAKVQLERASGYVTLYPENRGNTQLSLIRPDFDIFRRASF